MDGDEAAVESPRAYRHIERLQGVNKFWRLFDGRGEVGIREEHILAARFAHSMAHAETLPSIHTVGNDPQAWKCLTKGFSNFHRLVLRAVIHDDNFRISSQSGQIRCDMLEGRR